MTETPPSIGIDPRHNPSGLLDTFERRGRMQVHNFLLEESADRIHRCLSGFRRWNLVYRVAGKHVDSDASAIAKWPRAQRRKLEKIVHGEARSGFQYRYSNIPIYDIFHQQQLPGHFLNDVLTFLNSDPFLGFVRQATGDDSISFADAQGTRYSAGDFLTCHDDDVANKHRRVAYVLGLTPTWRPEWGGLLAFVADDGNVADAYVPCYNTLTLFRVPTKHFVSLVSPFTDAARYSITGWLRSGTDPRG